MNYKVGDLVKVVAMKCGHQFNTGEVVTIETVYDHYYAATNGKNLWYLNDSEIQPYTPPHQIEAGGKYTSRNGISWECIFVRDGVAWLNHGNTTAYSWKLDGTPICLGAGSEYTIDLGPKVEVIDVKGSIDTRGQGDWITYHKHVGDHKFNMEVTILDGVPDWTTAKVTPCD